MTSYMTKRNKILDDPAASIWLKTQISVLEVRDPVDAFNDADKLLSLALLRMETAFRTEGFESVARKRFANSKIEQAGAGYRCEGCGCSVLCDPDREDLQIKRRLCTGCWLRTGAELRERRMGRVRV